MNYRQVSRASVITKTNGYLISDAATLSTAYEALALEHEHRRLNRDLGTRRSHADGHGSAKNNQRRAVLRSS